MLTLALTPGEQNTLQVISAIFDQVNVAYREAVNNNESKQVINQNLLFG